MRRKLALLTAPVLLVLPTAALGSAAAGTVAPTAAQRAAIVKGFGDPKAASPCLTVRLAASDHHWASVQPKLTHSCLRYAFDGVNALEQVSTSRWKVVFEGSSYRCPVAHVPRQVQRDLRICR